MKYYFKGIITVISFPLFLLQANDENQNGPKFSCRVKDMVGEQPDEICYIRDFIKMVKKTPQKVNIKVHNGDYNAHIFYGKSKSGKTMVVKQMAIEAGAEIDLHTAKELSQEIKKTDNIPALFDNIYANAKKLADKKIPVIIIFDDLDKLIKQQDEATASEIFGSLCRQIDQHQGSLIITIYTSKGIKEFEHAFLTRCTRRELLLPDAYKRKEISIELAKKHQFPLSVNYAHYLSLLTPGFSIGDLNAMIEEASKRNQLNDSFPIWHGYWMAMKNNKQLSKSYISNSILFFGSATLAYLCYKYRKKGANQHHAQEKES